MGLFPEPSESVYDKWDELLVDMCLFFSGARSPSGYSFASGNGA